MIFLIEYSRSRGEMVRFETFTDVDRHKADNERFEIELRLNRAGIEHEVVLLEAATEAALRRTHRRYFEDYAQLATLP
jgi:hypothetical protein